MTKLKYIEKALLIGFVIAILFSFTSFTAFAAQCEQIPNEVFRLHVLANSDSEEDQALKLKVRDRLLVGALSFLPALALGPIAEFFSTIA